MESIKLYANKKDVIVNKNFKRQGTGYSKNQLTHGTTISHDVSGYTLFLITAFSDECFFFFEISSQTNFFPKKKKIYIFNT